MRRHAGCETAPIPRSSETGSGEGSKGTPRCISEAPRRAYKCRSQGIEKARRRRHSAREHGDRRKESGMSRLGDYAAMEVTMRSESSAGGFPCLTGILGCLVLSVVYVGSLYVWRSPLNSDHPSVIKRRFLSVFVMTFLSPLFLHFGINEKFYQGAGLWELLGLRWPGLTQAIIIPLCLTMVLFLGPLYMQGLNSLWRLYVEPTYWLGSAQRWVWWRNQVVAPLSEEWTFRACMLPMLMQCFAPSTAIFICPLFFGVAHFHHLFENTRRGMDFKTALFRSCFQFVYTTVFGAYAAFLFAKTGHFAAPFAAHSFCNHMGFPDLSEIVTYKNPLDRIKLFSMFVIGIVAWCLLLTPMTNPAWFSNNLYWQKRVE